jgi:hypothetical protein
VYNARGLGDCLNPPCQTGGAIVVNGTTVQLAADVEVQGTGDNRILRRVGSSAWFSIYAIPADFIVSGATPSSLYDSWTTRLNAEYAAAHPDTAAPAPAASSASMGGLSLAGFASNPLFLAAGLGLVAAFLLKRKGRR